MGHHVLEGRKLEDVIIPITLSIDAEYYIIVEIAEINMR